MSKKPELTDVPGLGTKMQEKLNEAGIKTVNKLSKSSPEKLAAKVDGLSEKAAAKLIKAAQEMISPPADKPKAKKPEKAPKKPAAKEKPKKIEKKKAEEKPKPEKPVKKKVEKEPKKAKPKTKPKKKEPKTVLPRDAIIDLRLLRIAKAKRKRQPKFRHEQAHRWTRVSDSWRKVRGIDSATREKRKGRIAMVSAGYRKPKAVRGLHPSRFVEVYVQRPAEIEGLDPDIHAIRIGSKVGLRKRQEIIKKADAMLLRVLNPGAPESIGEEDLFTDLDDLEMD